MFGLRQRIPGHDKVQEMERQVTAGFGSRWRIPSRDRVLSWFYVAIGIPCRDMVLRF